MTARPVLESLRRGALTVAANPLLLLAPVTLAVASFVATVAPLALVVASAGIGSLGELHEWREDSSRITSFLERLLEQLTGPGTLAGLALGLLVTLTLLMLLAGYLQAGTFAVALAADARAPHRAGREAFRVETGPVFHAAGRRCTWRLFGLFNILGLALLVAFAPLLAGVAVLVLGIAKGGLVPGVIVTLLGLPVAFAAAIGLHLATLASERVIVGEDLPLLDGVAAGLTLLRETLGSSLLMLLATMAVGVVVSGLISGPRTMIMFSTFGSRPLPAAGLLVSALLLPVEILAACAVNVVTTAAFAALWGPAPAAPPVALPAIPPSPADPSALGAA